ncbi:UrcA family protein [Sphingosinicella sp. BN140058]|uniref:UrcA family protein n=1 Tax=Sphingosinicella sp. BN140058 TaxID=1892855 RepID=UPI001012A749|nr:UrcA family protein [Sphingosinicella sp. BN140058]QAY76348.1 UrcA family protein [Sphingosinicella sp. BN140058]
MQHSVSGVSVRASGQLQVKLAVMVCACALIAARAEAGRPVHQIEVDVSDLDLRSGKGKVTRDYRVGASASAACGIGESQRGAEFRACVDLAVGRARRTCRTDDRICHVPIDPRARALPPRLSLGSRSSN